MLFKICQKQSELSKIKVYNTINENQDIIRRNWQLMYLGTDNLSAEQIKKINYSIDTFSPKKDKMNLFRLMLKQGLSKFDVERFFFILNFTLKH